MTVLKPTINPTASETRPHMIRTHVSRPNSSVPNQWLEDGMCMRFSETSRAGKERDGVQNHQEEQENKRKPT
jgi:hypothetical protein